MAKPGTSATVKEPIGILIKRHQVKMPDMVSVPEGQVLLGTSDDQVLELLQKEDWAEEWYDRELFTIEQPQHVVGVSAFQIARYPVSNSDYHHFIWTTGYRVPREWIGFRFTEGLENHPVTGVSRLDVLAYIHWLNEKLGAHFRLPTEAEWERAARGDDDRIYPWGNDFDPWRCNTMESGKRGTTSNGEYSPSGDSPWQVNDMAGNVWEWTNSVLKPYPYDPQDGREDPKSNGEYVIRGGSWYYSRKLSRCSCREGAVSTFFSPSLGFRLARDG
jgi:formylglycine-generating enzyme required for sulfatase activity